MRATPAIAGCLLAVHAVLVAWESWHTSPTLNEVAHLPAGIYAWEFGHFDVYRVNPPLVRSLAALPALAGGARTDWRAYEFGPGLRPEWELGKGFIRANPTRWRNFYAQARWAVLPLTLLGALTCYRWSSRLYGPRSGLLSLALWCFCPNVIAWASTITPDASAAALGVLACYGFWRWLDAPTLGRAVAAGAALGLAELTKMTWVILLPLWPALWLFHRRHPSRNPAPASQLGIILVLGLFIINLGYGFDGSFKRLDAYQFVSRPLAGPASQADRGPGGNRFSGSWGGRLPVPVPEDYLLGLDLQQLDFDRGSCCYRNGTWYPTGTWFYYLYALLLKVPLGTWSLGLLALLASLGRSPGGTPGWRDEVVLLAPGAAVLVLVSSATSINQHVRYVLPALPFAFIGIGKAARLVGPRSRLGIAAVLVSLGWSVASSLSVYPHDISYFNELAGGPTGGHACLIDSNIDWGQDLFDLKRWYDEHPQARPLYLACYGAVDPSAAGIESVPAPMWPPPRERAFLSPSGVGPQPGWYAVSVNHLRGHRRFFADEHPYEYLLRARPIATAGYSIYIFYLSWDEANSMRRDLGLHELSRPRLDAA